MTLRGLVTSSTSFKFIVLLFLFQLTFMHRLLVSSYLTHREFEGKRKIMKLRLCFQTKMHRDARLEGRLRLETC